jgi:hypothetical protein
MARAPLPATKLKTTLQRLRNPASSEYLARFRTMRRSGRESDFQAFNTFSWTFMRNSFHYWSQALSDCEFLI